MIPFLLAACFSEPGVGPEPSVVAAVQQEREARERLASPAPPADTDYTRREGVGVDVAWFGGRSYTRTREELVRQLGAVVEEAPLRNGRGSTWRFERGSARVEGDTIVGLSVNLPQPARPEAALRWAGFAVTGPPAWIPFSGELRLTNEYGFRRIIVTRVEPRGELVNRLDVWKRDPSPGG